MIRIDIATLFPAMCEGVLAESIVGRAIMAGHIDIVCHDIRHYTENKHNRVDDKPYGGGTGMVMQAQPVYDCIMDIKSKTSPDAKVIYMSPQGKTLTQEKVKELASLSNIVILCGHYEGVDQRVLDELEAEEVSIGDYVLTGGELPALVLADAISRLQENVLPNEDAYSIESHYNGLLEHPQYSRPEVWKGRAVPSVLLSGDHSRIQKWQEEKSYQITLKKRPDLLYNHTKNGKPYAKYVKLESDYTGKPLDIAVMMKTLIRRKLFSNREIKDIKKILDWFKSNNGFCADCPTEYDIYLKAEKAAELIEMYTPLLMILSSHNIPYRVIFADNIGEIRWEDGLRAAAQKAV